MRTKGYAVKDGLSPLARGTHSPLPRQRRRPRFIPAGAGNTPRLPTVQYAAAVYPRWRGEHSLIRPMHVVNIGLSPLARGTRIPEALAALTARFIPAGAGNTLIATVTRLVTSVYPRWRGEHLFTGKSIPKRCGLSPLARGTLQLG